MKTIDLFCVAHKEPPLELPAGYRTIGVSGYLRGEFSDHLGERNIAGKNSRFCELSAIYWLINNYSFSGTHAGICHYRRIWSDEALLPPAAKCDNEYIVYKSKYPCQQLIARLEDMAMQLYSQRSDLLMPLPVQLLNGVGWHYKVHHDIDDLFLAFNVAIKKGYVTQGFAQYFLNQTVLYPYNMGILPTELFVTTWSKILDLLLSIEDQIPEKKEVYRNRPFPITRTASYQNRVFGFLAERLFTALIMSDLSLRLSTRAVMLVHD